MRWWQWTVYVLLLVVVLSLFDGAFRVLLRGNISVTNLNGKRDNDTLIIYLPGLVADGEYSGRQMQDTWRDFGDVWLVNPTGDRYESDLLVKTVTERLENDDHSHVIFIGSSLGAHNARSIMESLSDRKLAATRFGLIPVCSPRGGMKDIKQPLQGVSVLARVFRFGPLTDLTWGKLFTRSITGKQPRSFAMTFYIDQVNYQRSMPDPYEGPVPNDGTVYLQAAHDEIVEPSAAAGWTTPDNVIVVDSKHVAYDADPEKWNDAFKEALTQLTDAR